MNKDKLNKVITFLKSADDRRDVLSGSELLSLKNKVFVAIGQPEPKAKQAFSWRYNRQKVVRYAVSFLLGFSLVGGTAFASTSSKPGDLLYPVKLATEKAKLSITFSENARVNLQAEFAGERLKELRQLDAVFVATSSNASVKNHDEQKDGDLNIRVQARAEAEVEVQNAIEALKQVQEKQQAKGNNRAAAELGQNIVKLQVGAKFQDLKIRPSRNDEGDNDNEQKNNIFIPATTTIRSQLNSDSDNETYSGREFIRSPQPKQQEDSKEDGNDDKDDDRSVINPPIIVRPATSTPTSSAVASYTLAQVALAKTSAKCWTIINGKVYNLTSWIAKHPGGESAILQLCGKDGTSLFMAQHGGQAKPESVLAGYFIGNLK